jgi:hypothetical protein
VIRDASNSDSTLASAGNEYGVSAVSNEPAIESGRPKRLTRRQAVTFLNREGFPVTFHAFNKYCSPKRDEGPRPVAFWGRLPLYEPPDLLRWAEARLRPVPSAAA